MDKKRLEAFMQLHNYGPEKAQKMVVSLLENLQEKGLSEKDAILHITRDLEKKGRIYQVIITNKPSAPETPADNGKPQTGFQCPQCGHPQKQGKECVKCGIVFQKLVQKAAEKKRKAKEVTPISAAIHRLSDQQEPKQSGGFGKWVSNNKPLSFGIFVVICILIGGGLAEQYYQRTFNDVLLNYKINLSMDSSDDFQTSLANLQSVIKTAASLVGKWGMPERDIQDFGGKTITAVLEFTDRMEEAAGQKNETLHGHSIQETEVILCRETALMISKIRKEPTAKQFSAMLGQKCSPAM